MAEFLTVNLGAILKNQSSAASVANKEKDSPRQKPDLSQISDWAKELKDRIEENQALDDDLRQSNYEIEAQFFKDYFNNNRSTWDADCAERLISFGEPLKKAIKILGFNRNINPILGFITNAYVVDKLIKTQLLNVNTFKAIYNAVSKKLVAHTEFMTLNDSNIIYCQDLYKRPASEIEKYLSIQSEILKPSASEYTVEDIEKNKKVFFYIKTIKEQGKLVTLPTGVQLPSADDDNTRMNSLDFATLLSGIRSNRSNVDAGADEVANGYRTLAGKIGNHRERAFAAIQYLSTTTDVPEAKTALKHEAFRAIPMEAFIAASADVTKIMKEADLPDIEIKPFISLLLGSLERS